MALLLDSPLSHPETGWSIFEFLFNSLSNMDTGQNQPLWKHPKLHHFENFRVFTWGEVWDHYVCRNMMENACLLLTVNPGSFCLANYWLILINWGSYPTNSDELLLKLVHPGSKLATWRLGVIDSTRSSCEGPVWTSADISGLRLQLVTFKEPANLDGLNFYNPFLIL